MFATFIVDLLDGAPKVNSPCSSAGSDLEGHDQSLAALPYDAISNAKTL